MLRLKDQKLINLNLRLRLEPIHCVTLGTSGALLSKKKKKNTLRIKIHEEALLLMDLKTTSMVIS